MRIVLFVAFAVVILATVFLGAILVDKIENYTGNALLRRYLFYSGSSSLARNSKSNVPRLTGDLGIALTAAIDLSDSRPQAGNVADLFPERGRSGDRLQTPQYQFQCDWDEARARAQAYDRARPACRARPRWTGTAHECSEDHRAFGDRESRLAARRRGQKK